MIKENTRARQAGQQGVYEMDLIRPDGERRALLVTATPQRDASGEVIGAFGIFRDVTEQRLTERALAEANQELTWRVGELERRTGEIQHLNEMGEMLQSCLDMEEAQAVVSVSLGRLFPGRSGALFLLSSSRTLLEVAASWGGVSFPEQVLAPYQCWALRRGHTQVTNGANDELHCSHSEPAQSPVSLCVPLVAHNETLGVLYLDAGEGGLEAPFESAEIDLASTVAKHISLAVANLRLRESLRDQAIRDPLTGLFNRRYLEDTLEREVRRAIRKNDSLSVIMLDIDHFKRYNDLYGHEAGDQALRALGGFLRASIRAEDFACRYGGEEFAIILPEADYQAAWARAEELRRGVKKVAVELRGQELGDISLSLGISVLPEDGVLESDLLRKADAALYQAKAVGRDRVVVSGWPASHLDVGPFASGWKSEAEARSVGML